MSAPDGALPALLTDDEIESRRSPANDRDRYQPLEAIRAQHPQIAQRIEFLWGSPEFDDYVAGLIYDYRGGRAGFPSQVMHAILALARYHVDAGPRRSGPSVWLLRHVEVKRPAPWQPRYD